MLENYAVIWPEVIEHYLYRLKLSNDIRQMQRRDSDVFVDLCLGIEDPQANYSASDHQLGPRILNSNTNARERIKRLAANFVKPPSSWNLAKLIKAANLRWLKISVGSEISMMMHPDTCWVANTRTIWAHLLVKHGWDEQVANEALALYRNGEEDSEMAYRNWVGIHRDMREDMLTLAEIGSRLARAEGYEPGGLTFLWADAVSNWLYENS